MRRRSDCLRWILNLPNADLLTCLLEIDLRSADLDVIYMIFTEPRLSRESITAIRRL